MDVQRGAIGLATDRPPDSTMSSGFPKTKSILWDKSAFGKPTFLHLSYYRKPKMCLPEKVLRLVQHQCENYGQTNFMLIGSLVVEDDAECVQFQVNRLDTRKIIPSDGSGLAPGDLLIPLEVTNNTAQERNNGSIDDFVGALRRLQERCCSKDSIDLCSFVLLRGWGSFYSGAQNSVVHLDFDMVTMETTFKATPIAPVPIVLTALSKNLAGPMSLSHMQGSPKTGYLTMDQTRKLLLVLESDPKTASLPIVGIWISGAEFIQHPYVWAACLRYIHNTHLQDRVCVPPEEFLLVLYTPLHSRPEFYQCCPTTGTSNFMYQLATGHEVSHLNKSLTSQADGIIEVEIGSVEARNTQLCFDAAVSKHRSLMDSTDNGSGWSTAHEDIEPRCAPTPHMEKVPVFQPMVPDVSILWTDSTPDFTMNNGQHFVRSSRSPPGMSQERIQQAVPFAQNSSDVRSQKHNQPHSIQSSHAQNRDLRNQMAFHQTQDAVNRRPMLMASQQTPQPISTIPTNVHHSGLQHIPIQHNIPQGSRFMRQGPQQKPHSMPMQEQRFQCPPQCHPPSPMTFQSLTPTSTQLPSQAQQLTASSCTACHIMPHHQGIQIQRQTSPRMLTSQPHHGMVQNGIPYNPALVGSNDVSSQHLVSAINSPQNLNTNANTQCIPLIPQQQVRIQPLSSNVIFTPAPQASSTSATHSDNLSSPQDQPILHPVKQSQLVSEPVTHQSLRQAHGFKHSDAGITHSRNRDFLAPITFLKTVVEQSSSSSCSSSSSQQSHASREKDAQLNGEMVSSKNVTKEVCSASNHNSTSSSAKSSDDDSGLSVTPDRLNPSPQQPSNASVPSVRPPESTAGLGIEGVNWEQVPPEIRSLLEQQSQQLRQLQQQLQLLMVNQSQQATVQSSHDGSSTAQLSSNGMNESGKSVSHPLRESPRHTVSNDKLTTVEKDVSTDMKDQGVSRHCRSIQTSPQKGLYPLSAHPSPMAQDSFTEYKVVSDEPQGKTISVAAHQGFVPVCSTLCDVDELGKSGTPTVGNSVESKENACSPASKLSSGTSGSDMNPGDLVAAMAEVPVYEHTMNTVPSDLLVDLPDYVSSSNSRSQLDTSPASASYCYGNTQDESFSTVAEDATDPKQYYTQLMNNIQLFLTNEESRETEPTIDTNQFDVPSETNTLKSNTSADSSSVAPSLNYVSMLLGSASDSSQSMEINAMAMKYLKDEQLTQMAKLRQIGGASAQTPAYTARILQQIIQSEKVRTSTTPDASYLGISPNNMTMGTRNYMERHGLLAGESCIMATPSSHNDASVFDHTYRLMTDFSIAASSDDKSLSQPDLTENRPDLDKLELPKANSVKSPIKKQVIKSQLVDESDGDFIDRKWLPSQGRRIPSDLGASPILRDAMKYEVQEMYRKCKNNFQNSEGSEVNRVKRKNCDSGTVEKLDDEDNILDIEKLKQLPKLL